MKTMRSADVMTILEVAALKKCSGTTVRTAVQLGALKAWKLRPVLLLRADVAKWMPKPRGRRPGSHFPPTAKTRRLGTSYLDLRPREAAEKLGVSRQAIEQARRRIRKYDAKCVGLNGQAEKIEKSKNNA